MRLDVIVPCYQVDKKYFYDNLDAMIMELPLRKMFLGIHNPKLYEILNIKQKPEKIFYKSGTDEVYHIDMTMYNTLGKVLVELMKLVETDWFAYFHADASPTPYSFRQMEPYMNRNFEVGIIESEHLHLNGNGEYTYHNYYNRPRAYSGFQLMYKPAIQSAIDQVEDDYVYRNEDLIFQNVCEFNGYEYKKSYALHIHQTTKITSEFWPTTEQETQDMQWRGLIKYSPLVNDYMGKLIVGSVRWNTSQYGVSVKEVLEFTRKENPIWLDVIEKHFGDGND